MEPIVFPKRIPSYESETAKGVEKFEKAYLNIAILMRGAKWYIKWLHVKSWFLPSAKKEIAYFDFLGGNVLKKSNDDQLLIRTGKTPEKKGWKFYATIFTISIGVVGGVPVLYFWNRK
jgi:hypothetical protein